MVPQTSSETVTKLYRYFIASADMYYGAVGERDVFVSIDQEGVLRIWGEMHDGGSQTEINLCEVFLEYGMYCRTWQEMTESYNVMKGFGEFLGDALAKFMKENIKFDSTENPGACALECVLESLNAQISIEQIGSKLSFMIADCPIHETAKRTGLREEDLALFGFNVMVQTLINSIDPKVTLSIPEEIQSNQTYSIKMQNQTPTKHFSPAVPILLKEWRVVEEQKIDAFTPPEMATRAVEAGTKKAALDIPMMFTLAVLAGAFIAMGAVFSVTVTEGMGALPYGLVRLFSGLAFTLGLILVIVAGSELFTGNNLIIMAYLSKRVSLQQLLRNWFIVYLGNFTGAMIIVLLMFFTKQYTFRNGAIGLIMLNIGESKTSLGFIQAIALGIACNVLVCLAVWMCFSARSTIDKILAIIPPIVAFVASGFEHSVANMYFIPAGLFIKYFGNPDFFNMIQKTPIDFIRLTWRNFFLANLFPVTIGNIIGGALMVGFVYWYLYQSKNIRQKPIPSAGVAQLERYGSSLKTVSSVFNSHITGILK
ncbi:MAG: formate transporter FocA [Anaerolineales bacterium]